MFFFFTRSRGPSGYENGILPLAPNPKSPRLNGGRQINNGGTGGGGGLSGLARQQHSDDESWVESSRSGIRSNLP